MLRLLVTLKTPRLPRVKQITKCLMNCTTKSKKRHQKLKPPRKMSKPQDNHERRDDNGGLGGWNWNGGQEGEWYWHVLQGVAQVQQQAV